MVSLNRDLSGQKFHMLLVDKKVIYRGQYRWRCTCDCGNTTHVREYNLITNHTKSCGCLRNIDHPRRKHGHSHKPEYAIWRNIVVKSKGGPNRHPYPVDPRWMESYDAFIEDVGERPALGQRLRRRVLELGYNKDNCYWR